MAPAALSPALWEYRESTRSPRSEGPACVSDVTPVIGLSRSPAARPPTIAASSARVSRAGSGNIYCAPATSLCITSSVRSNDSSAAIRPPPATSKMKV